MIGWDARQTPSYHGNFLSFGDALMIPNLHWSRHPIGSNRFYPLPCEPLVTRGSFPSLSSASPRTLLSVKNHLMTLLLLPDGLTPFFRPNPPMLQFDFLLHRVVPAQGRRDRLPPPA